MSIAMERIRGAASRPDAGYRTLWRWHFYAGLFVMPLLVVLAITGTLYCFKPQLEPLLYPHLMVVEPQGPSRLDADELFSAASAAVPDGSAALSMQVLRDPDRSAEFVFRFPDGEQRSVYVNPYDGTVLGSLSVEDRFMQVTRMVHRKLLVGKPGELLMELAACWTLVMIITGVALWSSRSRSGKRLQSGPRLPSRGRVLWKSIHATMGIWLAVGGIAFVLTGLPWTGFWGKHFQSFATSVNLGSPPGAWGDLPLRSLLPGAQSVPSREMAGPAMHHGHHGSDSAGSGVVLEQLAVPAVPWAVAQSPVPDSAAAQAGASPIPIERIIDQVAGLGVHSEYALALPTSPQGVYTVTYFPADPRQERTIYIDQYSGAVLRDIRYEDYGAVAQAVSYGTSLHMGRYFGFANQLVSAFISLGLGMMAVTGAIMWWKRRPSRSLGAPAREHSAPPMRRWKAALAALGIVFPLMGITLLAVWIADRLLFPGPAHHS